MKEKYCHSSDGEVYYGAFDTEQEALEDAKETYLDDEQCYIVTATEPELRWCTNEEHIIESIVDNLCEEVGEVAENFEVTTEQELELARMIDETVKLWIKKENIKPQCYSVLDGHVVLFDEKSESEE